MTALSPSLHEIIRKDIAEQLSDVLTAELLSPQLETLRLVMEFESLRKRVEKLETASSHKSENCAMESDNVTRNHTAPASLNLTAPPNPILKEQNIVLEQKFQDERNNLSQSHGYETRETQPNPAARELIPLVVGEEALDPGRDPPASLLNYCFWALNRSTQPFLDPSFKLLVLLMMVQQTFMNAFVTANEVHLFSAHMHAPPKSKKQTFYECMFAGSTILDQPTVYIGTSLCAILLITLLIKKEDADGLRAKFAYDRHTPSVAWFMYFVVLMQSIYLPGCFAIEAVQLFATSADSLEVVMNTLAVTFIMDIDNMLYESLLTHKEKALYQEDATCMYSKEENLVTDHCEWGMFLTTIGISVVHFINLITSTNLYGGAYINHWSVTGSLFAYFPVYGTRGAWQMWRHEKVQGNSVTLMQCSKEIFKTGGFGGIMYVIMTTLTLYNIVFFIGPSCANEQQVA